MVDIAKLKAELTDDPLTRGYSGMTDVEAAASLNTVDRDRPKGNLSGDELFTATDAGEFSGLTDEKRALWVSWCNTDRDPYNAANVAFVTYIFGAGTTLSTLQALRKVACSRAVELGLGELTNGHIEAARR